MKLTKGLLLCKRDVFNGLLRSFTKRQLYRTIHSIYPRMVMNDFGEEHEMDYKFKQSHFTKNA